MYNPHQAYLEFRAARSAEFEKRFRKIERDKRMALEVGHDNSVKYSSSLNALGGLYVDHLALDEDKINKYPEFSLSYGQVIRLICDLYYLDDDREQRKKTDAFMKELRKHGVPFREEELGAGRGNYLKYQYHHIMEVVIAIIFYAGGADFLSVCTFINENRQGLHLAFAIACVESNTGFGSPVKVSCGGVVKEFVHDLELSGVFMPLILQRENRSRSIPSGDGYMTISPVEALERLMKPSTLGGIGGVGLIPLSSLALDVIQLAVDSTPIKRGPKS